MKIYSENDHPQGFVALGVLEISRIALFTFQPIRRPRKARVEVPHCRAKVKVRVRTGGENRTAPEIGARAAHDCSCWG
jgi:hypothetical protein